MSVIWHDVECGGYAQDLSLWRSLAAEHGDPVLDVGAGTGRIALDLARRGHEVVALDHDPALVAELTRRAEDLSVTAITADAREFDLGRPFALCIVPMQTIQLLGGADGRRAFLECAKRHLAPGGLLAVAIAPELELFEVVDGGLTPLPDIREVDGVVYSSLPTAVRADPDGFVLERRRERISVSGSRSVEQDVIRLDRLT
ncbi:MAG: class I SAM-dependent methyltransferase, partial [Solirubrobacterales bacterium]